MSENLLSFRGVNITRFCGPIPVYPETSRSCIQIDLNGPFQVFTAAEFAELVRRLRVISEAVEGVEAADDRKRKAGR